MLSHLGYLNFTVFTPFLDLVSVLPLVAPLRTLYSRVYCNFNSSDLSDNLPSFYRECLNVWSKLTAKPAESREEVLKQILWNNQFVRINDKPVFNRRLFSKGIVFISDILTNNGKLKPWPSFAATGLTLVDFFSLLGIFDSLPSPWKSLISSNGTPIVFHGPPVMQHHVALQGMIPSF